MDRKDLIEAVIGQIMIDIDNGDFTAIWELLGQVDEDTLAAFISEEKLSEIRG
jgi:hypothetical protein